MDEVIQKKLEIFFSSYKLQTFKKGEILIRADEDPSGIYFLKSGGVKEYVISQKGEELIVNTFKPFSFFPMSWAMNATLNKYYFEVTSDTSIWKAPKEDVLSFLRSEPDVIYDLLRRVYKGTDGMMMRMTFLMGASAHARLIMELIIQSKRFGKKRNGEIVLPFSEKELAAYTGMTRETISREMKLLKKKNLVTHGRNILIIPSLTLLEEELHNGV